MTRSLESTAKSVTKAATKAVTRSTEQAMREARKATIGSVKRTVRDTEKAVAAAVNRQGAEQGAKAVRKPPGQFVTVDGLPVHVIVRGRGRPVVLVHGNGTMAEDFAICGLIDRLAARYRVIAIDRPGFGYTGRPRHRIWTAQAQAVLLHRVLEQLGVERPLLVGHSWGTIVALALAADGRRPLRGLVLLSGSYFPGIAPTRP
ncbi:alpha-beta hydrolase superfamily lysophospholipase [Methylobacterium sp. RAS18]|nr:alpha-beta hydrolase superfamily lysophospholipase [Methylobacterium sp. RAS18]